MERTGLRIIKIVIRPGDQNVEIQNASIWSDGEVDL